MRNHAQAIVACDFCVAVTATFWVLHVNVTRHPTAAWTRQQFREVLAVPHAYRFALHDRDAIYSPGLDAAITAMGVRVLRTPIPAPTANAYCERFLGSLRRECLDYLMPFGEDHLRRILCAWRLHYNRGRPYASLGPGIPEPGTKRPAAPIAGPQVPCDARVVARSILGGLRHEFRLEKLAA